jgi:hypothetical protein
VSRVTRTILSEMRARSTNSAGGRAGGGPGRDTISQGLAWRRRRSARLAALNRSAIDDPDRQPGFGAARPPPAPGRAAGPEAPPRPLEVAAVIDGPSAAATPIDPALAAPVTAAMLQVTLQAANRGSSTASSPWRPWPRPRAHRARPRPRLPSNGVGSPVRGGAIAARCDRAGSWGELGAKSKLSTRKRARRCIALRFRSIKPVARRTARSDR